MNRQLVTVFLAVIILLTFSLTAQCKIIYVKTTGSDTNSGLSWDLAKKTVTSGINTASTDDEIWVAGGVYEERITLKSSVGLYGGFIGTESDRYQRDFKTNETILDGKLLGVVVIASAKSCIDGFTIRKGKSVSGGGISCSSAATIKNNLIVNNIATGIGAGIYCSNASPIIMNNIIKNNNSNSTGGGIHCEYSSATIANNVIISNRSWKGAGIFCYSCSPSITNNAILSNISSLSGSLCLMSSSSPSIQNNIVAFNSSGISASANCTPVLHSNCFYNPGGLNYSGITSGTGDISVDPELVGWRYGGIHLQPDSPCVDAGNDNAIQTGWTDIDGKDRSYGEHVDIGADEWDGTLYEDTPNIIVRVSPSGNNSNNGSSWSSAKKTIQAGIDAASPIGGEVWVAKGTYQERINLRINAYLYGGFAGTETRKEDRDYCLNATILDGGAGGTAVTADNISVFSGIDGFTICNGKSDTAGGGISCSYSSPAITNNIITRNIGNSGGGIYCAYSGAIITDNIIRANGAIGGGGIFCINASPTIIGNYILANTSNSNGSGIDCKTASPTIIDNIIAGNSSGSAVTCEYTSSAFIGNNTIVNNNCRGIYYRSSSPTIVNNIIANNRLGGIRNYDSTGAALLENNCVYNPSGQNYLGLAAGLTDISIDPKLADPIYGNYHLQSNSPCIDSGSDSGIIIASDIDDQDRIQSSHVDIGADESDGTTYPTGPYLVVRVTPFGNDENDGSTWISAKKTVQSGIDTVSAMGGEVWVAAGTYNECIKTCSNAYLYGGFSGDESTRGERDSSINLTILDGGASGPVVTAQAVSHLSTIDGFIIRNGSSNYGGGINCQFSCPVIANNTITNNKATIDGAGISCQTSAPTILNNIISNNCAASYGGGISCVTYSPCLIENNSISENSCLSDGGAIYCSDHSSVEIYNNGLTSNKANSRAGGIFTDIYCPSTISNNTLASNSAVSNGGGIYCAGWDTITNNTLVGNSSNADGGGIYCYQSCSPTVTNNIVAFNTPGIFSSGTPSLSNNDVFQNNGYEYSGLSAGPGDISLDPLFVDRANGDYHLSVLSPCINAGWNDAPNLPSKDFEGEQRIQGSTVDIGADECWLKAGSLKDAKKVANDILIDIDGLPITAAFPDYFYVENTDRSNGIRIDKLGHGLSEGTKAHITGSAKTNLDGERFIEASTVDPAGDGEVFPLLLTNHTLGGGTFGLQQGVLGGYGLNNIGLLIKTFGKVTFVGDEYFYIDDGSALNDNSGHLGIKVYGIVPVEEGEDPIGKFVTITGISSCEKPGSDPIRIIRTRDENDVVVLN